MNVFRNLKKLLRPSRPSNRMARRHSARLELVSLDQRLVPSASILPSGSGYVSQVPNLLGGVTDVKGSATGFYLDRSDGVLFQLRDSIATPISPPLQPVTQFAAGLNQQGFADVFAQLNGRI